METFDLAAAAQYIGFTLSDRQQKQFERYLGLLQEWNARMNLTAVTEPRAIQIRHFLDSLTCATVTGSLAEQRLVDVGTGAGFPGLPLKILFPSLRLTLVDSVRKKTEFLAAVVADLGLIDVEVLPERAEVLGQQPAHRAQYDWAVARSVAELRVLAEFLLPLCRVGGRMLAQKGESAATEVTAAEGALRELGGGFATLHPITLPDHPLTHYLVVVEKVKATPAKYPRPVGRPAKRPL